jgi:hypothetical protein
MIVGFYYLIYLHVKAYMFCIMPIIKRRLGLPFSLLWTATGAVIGFNVLFNHFMACITKASGPVDLIRVEKLRMQQKNRAGRKAMQEESDRYEGISSEIK